MNATHTPGPWFHIPRNRDGHTDKITDREGNESRVFVMVGSPVAERPILDHPHENTQTANARLIAAAPELLKALERQHAANKLILEVLRKAYDRFTDNDMVPPNEALQQWLVQAGICLRRGELEDTPLVIAKAKGESQP